MFRLDLQLSGMDALQAVTDPKLYDKALAGGLRYAAASVPPASARVIRTQYNIGAARIKIGRAHV